MDAPEVLQIETTNRCNIACSFCPHKNMTREQGVMEQAMFESVVKQASDMGIATCYPILGGEPFMDKDYSARVKHILSTTDMSVCTYSNLGIPLKKTDAENLQGSGVVCSFTDQANPVTRIKNIEMLKMFHVPVVIHAIEDYQAHAYELSYRVNVTYKICGKYNWAGQIPSDMPFRDGICMRAPQTICVLWDGRVSLCCLDMDGDVILGDLNTQSMGDIWEGEKAIYYRTHTKSSHAFCKSCNMQLLGEE